MQVQQDDLIRVTISALRTSIEAIRAKLNESEKALHYQESLLNKYPDKNGEYKSEKESPPASKTVYTPSIGGKSTKDAILDIFNEENRPLKIIELQSLYQNKTNSKSSIKEFCRKMVKRKELRIVKINNSNRNSFWIKSEWLDKGELKDEYRGMLQLFYNLDELTII